MRLLTWNLWWRFGPWEARQPAILEKLGRVDADVLCLQEVWETRGGESQAEAIADALGYRHVYAAGLG
ncbi:MAG: endonuclease/exonuclease/phosphatase family protein, partial [Acidimicrobiia bacterium]|nr:endonuclease/exonuclease/phosphatase family protein [Acidimicrobiia bacterium]